MKSAFITGATGFLGRHITDVLLENEWHVTAFVRSPEKAAKLLPETVSVASGDLTSALSIKEAMPEGVDAVFHAAANTSTWSKEAHEQEMVNIEGTRALLQAMLDNNAGRLVHVSSIAVYGEHEGPISEESERRGVQSRINYARTKGFAERKVKEAVDRGMDAVIVNPTHIIGKYDTHNWARLILQFADGSLPATPSGGGNFANARAVAEAIVRAYDKGHTGENYILSGPQASFHEFLQIVSSELKLSNPPMTLGRPILMMIARLYATISFFTGKRPKVTLEEAYMSSEQMEVQTNKAASVLGYRTVPLEVSIRETITYLREVGLLAR